MFYGASVKTTAMSSVQRQLDITECHWLISEMAFIVLADWSDRVPDMLHSISIPTKWGFPKQSMRDWLGKLRISFLFSSEASKTCTRRVSELLQVADISYYFLSHTEEQPFKKVFKVNLLMYCSQISLSLSVRLLCTVSAVLVSDSLIKYVFCLWEKGWLTLLSEHTLMQRRRHTQERSSKARIATQDMKRVLVTQHIHTIRLVIYCVSVTEGT